MEHKTYISWLLRIGVAFAFLYPAIDGFFNPGMWIGFLPPWLAGFAGLEAEIMLLFFGLAEIIIALGLLFLKDPRIPAYAAAIVLGLIVVVDFSAFAIVFRDISILLMAVALIVLHQPTVSDNMGTNYQHANKTHL